MHNFLGQALPRETKSDEEQQSSTFQTTTTLEKPLPKVESNVSLVTLSTQSSVHKSEDARPPVADIGALAKELGKLIEPKRELSASSIHSVPDVLPSTTNTLPPAIAIEIQKASESSPSLGVGDASRINLIRNAEHEQVNIKRQDQWV